MKPKLRKSLQFIIFSKLELHQRFQLNCCIFHQRTLQKIKIKIVEFFFSHYRDLRVMRKKGKKMTYIHLNSMSTQAFAHNLWSSNKPPCALNSEHIQLASYARIRGSLLTFDHWSHIFFISIANKCILFLWFCVLQFSSSSLSHSLTFDWHERDAFFISELTLKRILFVHCVCTNFACIDVQLFCNGNGSNVVNFLHLNWSRFRINVYI